MVMQHAYKFPDPLPYDHSLLGIQPFILVAVKPPQVWQASVYCSWWSWVLSHHILLLCILMFLLQMSLEYGGYLGSLLFTNFAPPSPPQSHD